MVRDPENPEKKQKVHVFVTTLGVSSKTFAIALPDEKTPRFLYGMNQAVAFMELFPGISGRTI